MAEGRLAGAVVLIGVGERDLYRAAFGHRAVEPRTAPMKADDIFDLASLTKVVATTTAVMQLLETGRIDLHRPVAAYWPDFATNGKARITVCQLLTHTSGLLPDLSSTVLAGADAPVVLAAVANATPRSPPGETFAYSDLNFIALGALVGRLSGQALDIYTRANIFAPLKMVDTGFRPGFADRDRIVPTDRENGRLLWGDVQDPTAAHMDGVAGHAGLFSTADDLARFSRALLQGGSLEGFRVLRPETVDRMTRPLELPGGVRRTLGWDARSAYSAGMDQAFGSRSFGHTGYTGCLLWIDPVTRGYLVVMTSRLHPDGRGDVKPLRQDLGPLAAALVRAGLGSQGLAP